MSNMEKAVLIDKLRLETDRPLRELTGSLRISKSPYEYCRAKLRAKDGRAQLRADIRRIFDGAGGKRGYRYVHNELREEGTIACSAGVPVREEAKSGVEIEVSRRQFFALFARGAHGAKNPKKCRGPCGPPAGVRPCASKERWGGFRIKGAQACGMESAMGAETLRAWDAAHRRLLGSRGD